MRAPARAVPPATAAGTAYVLLHPTVGTSAATTDRTCIAGIRRTMPVARGTWDNASRLWRYFSKLMPSLGILKIEDQIVQFSPGIVDVVSFSSLNSFAEQIYQFPHFLGVLVVCVGQQPLCLSEQFAGISDRFFQFVRQVLIRIGRRLLRLC